jgi:phage gp46-like protein
MIDVKFDMDNNGLFDFSIVNGDANKEDGFDTSIWVSLFTDARADESQVAIKEYRRGWLGNLAYEVEGRQLGSLLYLLDQTRLQNSTLNNAIDYTRKALNWYLEDGICRSITVTGNIIPKLGIALNVSIISSEGVTYNKYVELWKVTGN